jgi:fumarylpyruvate hydrolase
LDREPPFFQQKNPDNILPPGQDLPCPAKSEDDYLDAELVVALGIGGANIPVASTLDHVFGYGVGLDTTRRDLHAETKDLRRPWDMARLSRSRRPSARLSRSPRLAIPSRQIFD